MIGFVRVARFAAEPLDPCITIKAPKFASKDPFSAAVNNDFVSER